MFSKAAVFPIARCPLQRIRTLLLEWIWAQHWLQSVWWVDFSVKVRTQRERLITRHAKIIKDNATLGALGSTRGTVHWHYLSSQRGLHSPVAFYVYDGLVQCSFCLLYSYMSTRIYILHVVHFCLYTTPSLFMYTVYMIIHVIIYKVCSECSCFHSIKATGVFRFLKYGFSRWLDTFGLVGYKFFSSCGDSWKFWLIIFEIHQQQQLKALWCWTCSICCLSSAVGKMFDVVAV